MSDFSLDRFIVAHISRAIEVKYSPSGVLIVILLLNQVSEQQENGQTKQVTLNLVGKYLGERALFGRKRRIKK